MAAARVRGRFLPALDLLPNIGLILVLCVRRSPGARRHAVARRPGRVQHLHRPAHLAAALLGMIIASAQRAAASAQRVQAVLATEPGIVDQPRRRAALPAVTPARRGPVRGRDVRLRGRARRAGARPTSTSTIAAGESVALVGATGSGKSTVARLLPALLRRRRRAHPDRRGRRGRACGVHDLRRAIGLVFEETFLFSDTIGDNIAFADPDADDEVHRAGRPPGRAPTSSSGPCPTATPPRSASGASRCRAASASASPSPGPSSPTPGC